MPVRTGMIHLDNSAWTFTIGQEGPVSINRVVSYRFFPLVLMNKFHNKMNVNSLRDILMDSPLHQRGLGMGFSKVEVYFRLRII